MTNSFLKKINLKLHNVCKLLKKIKTKKYLKNVNKINLIAISPVKLKDLVNGNIDPVSKVEIYEVNVISLKTENISFEYIGMASRKCKIVLKNIWEI